MAQIPTAGHSSYLNYGYEASYGVAATGTRVFGSGQKITTTRRNNMERIHTLGYRNAQALVALKYEGSASVEFNLSNASFFRSILGQVADGGSGPSSFTHTYTETNVLPSFSIVNGTELGTNDEVNVLVGCKVETGSLTATQGEIVKVRLECPYQTETLATTPVVAQVAELEDTYTFALGVLQLPSGSTIGYVQSCEMTFNHNPEGLWGLGSRIKAAHVDKIRQYDIRMTVAFSDVTVLLTKFLGAAGAPVAGTPASQATLVLTFTNGTKSIALTFANIYINEETLPKDVNEIIKEDVTAWALSCTSVVWTNSTAVDIGNP